MTKDHLTARLTLEDARKRLEDVIRISPEAKPVRAIGAGLAAAYPFVLYGSALARDTWCTKVDFYAAGVTRFELNIRLARSLTSASGGSA